MSSDDLSAETVEHLMPVKLPRVAITYCTQCRWMLRAAYFGQELLSTFGTSIGEIALLPATGGTFTVRLTYKPATSSEVDSLGRSATQEVLIWDYKTERCFPETKILKQKIRNFIDPGKSLGHSDTPSSGAALKNNIVSDGDHNVSALRTQDNAKGQTSSDTTAGKNACNDCA